MAERRRSSIREIVGGWAVVNLSRLGKLMMSSEADDRKKRENVEMAVGGF